MSASPDTKTASKPAATAASAPAANAPAAVTPNAAASVAPKPAKPQRTVLLLVSGPAGCGKTTVCNRLCEAFPDTLRRVLTCTTRAPRPDERDGVDYRFLSPEEFARHADAGDFIEHATVHGKRYGTLKSDVIPHLISGMDLLLNIDVQGAASICHVASTDPVLRPAIASLFILPPDDRFEHRERLRKRGDSEADITRRLSVASEESKHWTRYDTCFRSFGREDDFERARLIYLESKTLKSRILAPDERRDHFTGQIYKINADGTRVIEPAAAATAAAPTNAAAAAPVSCEPAAVPADTGRYAARGVSASKTEVHAVVDKLDPGLFPGAFCKITEDFLTGDPARCNLTHSDGSGTKSILAYLWWRETGDATVFRGIAQDSIVMNVDDLLCVGATSRILLSSTINRNARAIPGAVLAELISGTEEFLQTLRRHGLDIRSGGGETADVGDLTPTLTVDSTATAVLDRAAIVDASRIRPGMQIVALASAGTCAYERGENSGIGSNGLTSARHELLSKHYAETYPETYDHATPPHLAYCGPHRLQDPLPGSTLGIGRALLSPTRTYAPFVLALLRELGPARVAGLIHCSGGALTKCLRFGSGLHYVKDNLHPVPPVFAAIQRASGTPAREMHQVYNMGQRLEVYCAPDDTARVLAIAAALGIAARVSGHVEPSLRPDARNHITLKTASGETVQYP